MRVLVTGKGQKAFLGNHVYDRLDKDHNISYLCGVSRSNFVLPHRHLSSSEPIRESFYCDLTNEDQVKNLLSITQPDVIYHLAAKATVKLNGDASELIKQNVLATQYLLENCNKGTTFIFSSSILVAGKNKSNDIHATLKHSPISLYGASKAASELLIDIYHKQGKITGKIFRLCAVIGGGLTHGIIYDFVKKLRSSDEKFPVIGKKPGSIKPFVYVSDVVDALINVTHKRNEYLPLVVNISSPTVCSVEKIAKLAMEVLGIQKEIVWEENQVWVGDFPYLFAETDKAILHLGWKPICSTSEEALKKALEDNL